MLAVCSQKELSSAFVAPLLNSFPVVPLASEKLINLKSPSKTSPLALLSLVAFPLSLKNSVIYEADVFVNNPNKGVFVEVLALLNKYKDEPV